MSDCPFYRHHSFRTALRRSVRALSCALLVLVAASDWAVPRAFPKNVGGPSVSFEGNRVRATGATPSATVYFASVSLYTADGMLHVAKPAGRSVADADGNAELITDVHTRSVWIVVDSEKGYTVAAPQGMMLREMDFGGEARENANGQIQRLLMRRFNLEVFLIRPDEGLWTAYFRDGGALDEDGEPNGTNNADLADLQPVGATAGNAERWKPGDYLFLVDRNSLEFHVAMRGPR